MTNFFAGLGKRNNENNGQQNSGTNFFAGLNADETPYQRAVRRYNLQNNTAAAEDEPGFFAGLESGFAGVLGGQLHFGEANSPFGGETFGEAANYFDDIVQDNARSKFANGAELSLDYLTDPQGLRYDMGNTIGSSAALGAETAVAMGLLSQTPVAGAAAAAAKVVPGLGKLWNSGILGKVAVGNVAGSGFEALSEGGNLVPELKEEGYSDEEIQDIVNRAAALNIGGLTLSNLIQSYGASKILGLLGGKTAGNVAKGGMALAGDLARRGTLAAGGGLVTNAGEEGMQSAIGNIAKNEPIDWQEVEANAKTGAATGAIMGLGGGVGGGYLQNRALRRAQEQAAAEEENATGFNTVEKMRALEGKIPYEAPDGTNCMRTIGIALEGTPYEGQINVDQAIATARELGQLESPDEYTPQPGDIAVVNGGNHVGMVTENGGIIQNGASHNGVYESEQSAADMFGKVDYYIRTSEYYNGRAGVGRSDLRGEYAEEADAATPDVDVPNVRIIPAQGFRTFDTAAAEAADNDANMQQAARRYTIQETLQAQREAEDYRDLTDEALDAVEAWQNYIPPQQAGRFRLPAGRTANYNPTQAMQTPFLDRARNRETARRADELMIENAQAARETAGQRPRFMGQSTPQFHNLLQRMRAEYEQNGANNLRRNAQISALTERAANGDRVAAQILSNALGRQSVRLEAQNNAVEDNEIYKGRVIAERQQRARDAAEREANRRDMLQSAEEYFRSDAFDSPLEGVRSEIKGTQESIKNMLRPIVDTILSGGGNRPMLVDTEEGYRKIRVSQNAPFYSDLYKKYGRRPTLSELYNEARDIYTGNGSIAVPGWERTAENEADFAHNEATLKELDENLEMYEKLEKKFAAEPNGGRRNGENTQRKEHNNQNAEPQESQQGRETGEESKNAEAEKEVTESKEPAAKAEKKESKTAKRPKAEAKFTDKTEKLVPQTAELRGNEITVISKPNAKARDSERYIGRELPEGEYTVTVDEWKKAGRFGNPNAAWHRLVKEKYAAAFPNTGVKAEGTTSGAEPVHDRIIDSQITAIKQAVKAYDEIHAAPATTVTEQQPAADNKRFDGERATSALDKLIGRKQPAQQEQQTGKKFMNVFDESELDAEIAKAKAEMSKLSANPFFNPALMKSLFKIGGIYMQRGVNNFADWSARMVEALGNKVRPFLKSAWDALQAYPADVKFNDDIMTATLEFVGSRAEDGRTREQIRNEFNEMYGEEYLSYVDAAYEGVQSYPTEIEENSNVIQEDVRQEAENETQETTAEETENPAQSKTAQEVTRQETQPAEQQGYGRNKDIYIEYNPKTRRLYVDVSKAKNKFREEEAFLIPAGFKWSVARQKWYGTVSDNPNEYDPIRSYAKGMGFKFEDTASTAQESAQQAESTEQEQTPATEEKTPQNVNSVDSANRVIINGDRSGIPEIFEANEETYLSWDGTRKTEYNLRKPDGEYFARKMPDGMWEKYGITKQIPLTRLTFKTAEGRRRFANDWVDGKIEGAKESVAAAKEAERKKQEEEQARQRMLDELPDATFNLNNEQNGIEIKFSSKPSEEVRRGLKEARYRWSSAKQLWYAKQTPAAMAFAESIGYVPENMVQSNQENNATTEQKPTQEVEANGHDNNAQGLRGVPENVSEREVPRAEREREAERVREGDVDERGSEVTGHSGRAAGERPVPGKRGLAGESAAQSSTGSDSEGTSERGSVRALKPSQKKNAKASEVPGHNFTITDDENIGKGGAKTKYKDNVAAIRLLKQLEAENRLATPEEQKVLARYVGWGGLSPVFSYGRDRDPAWDSEKAEIKELLTDEEYSATTEATETRSYDEVIAELENALPTAKFEVTDGGEIVAEMPNKVRFKVNVADKVIVNDSEAATARSAHNLNGDIEIAGMWQRIKESDIDGALTVSRTGRKGTAYHEVMHAAMDLALTDKERTALVKHFAKKAQETGKSLEEAIADGYAEWVQARKRGSGTMLGKLFNKMRDMYYQLKAMFTGMENAENVMRRVESGEAWAQRGDRSDGSATRYSASENRTAEQKVANAMSSTERKTTFQRAKDWIAQQKKDFYRDWFDKNISLQDLVNGLEMALGRKLTNVENIYNRVRTLPSTTAGVANALIEGGKEELKAINSRLKAKLKYPVTMQMVLDNINREKMDAAHPNYLKKSGFKSWIEAFGAYLTSIRLNEMMLLHDEAYKEKVKEWEANGKKGRKPAYKPYLLPKGITQTDLETVIKNAPPEFRKAANMYYQFNDNVLTILEDAGLIDAETHRILNTKYKYYCPLMRDFSDTAAADSFIGGLTNGGRGIANVSNMLKRISIEGSERKVLNPLESTIKSVAVACNRAERNKVGQLAVQLAAKGGMDGVIQPVEGTTADAKNCIFTVMFDGKKQAYKTIPELYDPIVGYNLPAANFMFGIARNAARLLRAGATSSPSFIIRNVIRDTIFAGVSSKNGFIPFVDTVRGMYALARDPRLKAEFKVAGVTAFKQYSSTETAVKGLDKMAGGKAKRDYDIGDWWNAFIGTLQKWSEFAEAGTRMGEFMRARAKGKSLEEAALDAREVTLDFSRSGVYGERANRYVPFFNAVLQGGDKMVRMFKEDPMGTSLKLAAYIILPSLALWAYNHDEDWYKELDPEIKATCWCLPGGIRIPKPQECGILFGSGIEAMLDQAFNNDPEAIKNWAEVFRENITPSIFPTLFLPIWEWNSNYSNFRDAPITPRRLENLPDELQYTPNTSALARTLGGTLKLSPLKIDNTFRGYTGTMGMALVHMFDWFADSKQNMPAKAIKEMPVIRDFTVNQNIQNRSVDDFYTMLHKANEQHAGYGVKGKPSPAVKGVRAAGKLISEAQKDIRELTVNPRLSPEVKRQRIDQKKTYIKNIAKKANTRFGRFFED